MAIVTGDPAASAAAPPGASADAFGARLDPLRRELLVHCYRMLGSIDDAEDAVQEAFARAWNRRDTYREDVSIRAWLYRIATNVCLDAIERRRRTPGGAHVAAADPVPFALVADASVEPEARYDARESVSLAFLTALQVLTPQQRAVLILRDVLSWRAAEVASLLDVSVPAANSALHRARQAIAGRYEPGSTSGPGAMHGLRALLDRYVRAWEAADIGGLVALLRDDAIVSMPPGLTVMGSDAIARFLADAVFDGGRRIRLEPVETNAVGPAYLLSSARGGPFEPYAVLVVGLAVRAAGVADAAAATDGGAAPVVSRMDVYAEPRIVSRFASGLTPAS